MKTFIVCFHALEVLRISTVVDTLSVRSRRAFGSTKNFYCCRWLGLKICCSALEVLRISTVVDPKYIFILSFVFGSTKNFYCCRCNYHSVDSISLEVLRISTVVDILRVATSFPFGSTKNFYCCRSAPFPLTFRLWKY